MRCISKWLDQRNASGSDGRHADWRNDESIQARAGSAPALNRHQHKVGMELRSRCILQHGTHDLIELVDRAIQSFANGFITPIQQKALEACFVWVGEWRGPYYGYEAPMVRLIAIFGDLFFLGYLKQDLCFAWEEGMREKMKCYGYTASDENFNVKIAIDPRPFNDLTEFNDRWGSKKISTLLHECCHAFIVLYGCRNHCRTAACEESLGYKLGTTGMQQRGFILPQMWSGPPTCI